MQLGQAEHSVVTTCAYCGVGCSFKAEMKGTQVVRMTPHKNGLANEGHACVKGRFAWGYATHKDRITKPMIREKITDPWREVSWDEALTYAATQFRKLQDKYGRDSIGGITSSRCTNEETYLVQKLVRAAFGNNNVDTCARVCHSPTGYGLKTTLGESAGTQTFASVGQADVIVVMGANPTDGHPVFGSRLKRRVREGAKLIVIDPRRIDVVDGPHVKATHHLQLRPGTNVAIVNALAHVIVTEGLVADAFVAERCETRAFEQWREFVSRADNSPEATADVTGVPPELVREAARLYATGGNAAIYYGLGVTEHAQGSTTVMGIANLAMATGNIGREGVGVNGCAARTTCRARATWARSRTNCPATGTSATRSCARSSKRRGRRSCNRNRGCASRTCSTRRSTAASRGFTARARTSSSRIRIRSTSRPRCRQWNASSCRTSS